MLKYISISSYFSCFSAIITHLTFSTITSSRWVVYCREMPNPPQKLLNTQYSVFYKMHVKRGIKGYIYILYKYNIIDIEFSLHGRENEMDY